MDISSYKHCPQCDEVFPVTWFYTNSARYDGLTVYCKSCQNNVNNKNSYRTVRERIVNTLEATCVECGYNKDIRALQIDHVDSNGSKERKSLGHYQTLKAIEANLESGKYQILCANCNFIKRDEAGELLKGIIPPEPVRGELREAVIAAKKPQGGQYGPHPWVAETQRKWREENPEAWAERNRKISETRKGKKCPRNKT